MLLGTILAILFYSVIKASFLTFNLFFFVLLALCYRQARQDNAISGSDFKSQFLDLKSAGGWHLLFYLGVLVLFFGLRTRIITDPATGALLNPHDDYLFYANLSDFLRLTGQENKNFVFNILDERYRGISPYHYFELWLTALCTSISGGLTFLHFYLTIWTLFLFILLLGYLSLFEAFLSRLRWYHFGVALFFVFSSIIYLSSFFKVEWLDIGITAWGLIHHDFTIPFLVLKLTITEIFLLASLCAFVRKKYATGIYLLLCLPLVTVAAAPSVFGGIFLTLLLNIRLKFFARVNNVALLVLTVSAFLFITIFWYAFNPRINLFTNSSALQASHFTSDPLGKLSMTLYYSWRSVAQIVFLYLPFPLIALVLAYWLIRQGKGRQLYIGLPYILALIVGALFSSLLIHMTDGHQFFIITAYSILKLLLTTLVFMVAERFFRHRRIIYYVTMAVFVLLFFRVTRNMQLRLGSPFTLPYTTTYLEEVEKLIKQADPASPYLAGLSLWAAEDFPEYFRLNYGYGTAHAHYLGLMRNGCYTTNASWYKIQDKFKNPVIRDIASASVIMQMIDQLKRENRFTSYEDCMLQLVKTYRVRYLVATPGAKLESTLRPLIEKEVIDANTGERFYLLKPF